MSIALNCDLRKGFGDARDQGQRPTCLAFAVSDVHAFTSQPFQEYSVDYLYYYSVQRMIGKLHTAGVSTTAIADALEKEGQPLEHLWPYERLNTGVLRNPPLGLAVKTAQCDSRQVAFANVCTALDKGKPIVLILRLTVSFYQPNVAGIVEPKQPDPETGLHAVVAVGHGSAGTKSGILIRNSWGKAWGHNGHAFLDEQYLVKSLMQVAQIN